MFWRNDEEDFCDDASYHHENFRAKFELPRSEDRPFLGLGVTLVVTCSFVWSCDLFCCEHDVVTACDEDADGLG